MLFSITDKTFPSFGNFPFGNCELLPRLIHFSQFSCQCAIYLETLWNAVCTAQRCYARLLSWYFIHITIFKIRLLEVSSTTSNQTIKIFLMTIIFIYFYSFFWKTKWKNVDRLEKTCFVKRKKDSETVIQVILQEHQRI